eukprot:12266563-Prorocentrum_lima.AAC.1
MYRTHTWCPLPRSHLPVSHPSTHTWHPMQLRCAQIRIRATAHGGRQSSSHAACPHPQCRAVK